MVRPGRLVLGDDFDDRSGKVNKKVYFPKQVTPWVVRDGVLFGMPNPPEVQAARTKYKGKEPRVELRKTPFDFVAAFDLRFRGGTETPVVPFIEFGHHCSRVKLSGVSGATYTAAGEMILLGKAEELRLRDGVWYHVLTEAKGDQFVFQVTADGFPETATIYAEHEAITESDNRFIGIAGTVGGTVEVDNLRIWEAAAFRPDWERRRRSIPTLEPTETAKAKKKKKQAEVVDSDSRLR
ncbi:MAG: hypothetical protein AAF532_00540 [Planctomycetota bacterium]